MSTDPQDRDLLTLVARYAPSRASLTTWTTEREDAVLDAITHDAITHDAMTHDAVLTQDTEPSPAPARRTRSRRVTAWAPVLAAACVLALVAGLAYAFGGGDHRPSGDGGHLPVLRTHPWHAHAIRSLGSLGTPLAHGSHLYVLEVGTKPTLIELDPGSGAVLGRATVTRSGSIAAPVYAGGRVWVASQVSATGVRLSGFTPDLSGVVHRTVTLTQIKGNITFDLTAPVDGSRLYLSTGRDVLVLAPRTGRTTARIATSADEVSVSPDGTTLYVVNDHHTEVTSVDTRTRHVTAHRRVVGSSRHDAYGNGPVNDLAATNRGYFVAAVLDTRPRVLTRFFYPAHLPGRVRVDGIGSATAVASPTHAHGGVAWGSGGTRLSCVDPDTGRVRARSTGIHGSVQILVTDLGGHLYGTYNRSRSNAHSTSALIELTPPRACGLS